MAGDYFAFFFKRGFQVGLGMRGMVLAIMVVQIGLTLPAWAEEPADTNRPISDILPLFAKNHCEEIKSPADQLFCGDPALNSVTTRLNSAIQQRLNRIPNRRIAIEENV